MSSKKTSKNILAIFAHPDDLSFTTAGTLAKWVKQGHKIIALSCTSGNVGTFRKDLSMEEVGKIREKELRNANKILGIQQTKILNFPDGGFIEKRELRERLIYYVRKYKADTVVTFDPWVNYEVHPDHVMVGRMAAEAAAFAGFPLLHPEQLNAEIKPYKCSEVWFMGLLGHKPNYIVDISSTFDKKVEAALEFDATLTLLAQLFAPNINPANVSQKELEKLRKYAKTMLNSMGKNIGKTVEIENGEAFYVQKILPGHFDNFIEQMNEMLGKPPAEPKIV